MSDIETGPCGATPSEVGNNMAPKTVAMVGRMYKMYRRMLNTRMIGMSEAVWIQKIISKGKIWTIGSGKPSIYRVMRPQEVTLPLNLDLAMPIIASRNCYSILEMRSVPSAVKES